MSGRPHRLSPGSEIVCSAASGIHFRYQYSAAQSPAPITSINQVSGTKYG